QPDPPDQPDPPRSTSLTTHKRLDIRFYLHFSGLRLASRLPLRHPGSRPPDLTRRIDRLSIEQGAVLRISGRITGEDLGVLRIALAIPTETAFFESSRELAAKEAVMTMLTTVVEATAIRPFQVSTPDTELTELRRRITATRFPEKETVTDFSQGVPL